MSVYKGVTIEDEMLLGPYRSFSNDPYPRAFPSDWDVMPTVLEPGSTAA